MKTVLIVFGTRPEAIKMAPIVQSIKSSPYLKAITCSTGQHREMLDQVLDIFSMTPDYDLKLMQPNQDLYSITSGCLLKMREVLNAVKPDAVLVQGDTTTAFATALAAFYEKIPVGHVEAGLRTYDKYSPFPEEINRHLITPIADWHFAPTQDSVLNLENENVSSEKIFLTGNTSIDALKWVAERSDLSERFVKLIGNRKLILMTAHRRENFGKPLERIFSAVREFAETHPDFHIVYPVHRNPNVTLPAAQWLSQIPNVSLVEPLGYLDLVSLMKQAHLVLTDSGGLQEEAPTLGKPVLVLRESTERPEAVKSGTAILVGSDPKLILKRLTELSSSSSRLYRSMARAINPFGSGHAALAITRILERELGEVEGVQPPKRMAMAGFANLRRFARASSEISLFRTFSALLGFSSSTF